MPKTTGRGEHGLLQRIADPAFILDGSGMIVETNDAARDLLGYSRPELTALSFRDLGSPHGPDLSTLSPPGTPTPSPALVRLRRRKGEPVPCVITAFPMVGGKEEGTCCVVARAQTAPSPNELSDLSAELQIELRYLPLVELVPGVIIYMVALDEAGSLLFMSSQVKDILGYTRDEFYQDRGLKLRQIHPEDRDRVQAELARCQAAGGHLRCEYRMLNRDRGIRWFRDEAVVHRTGDGSPAYIRGVMMDITDGKRTEEQLRYQKTLLECQWDASIEVVLVVAEDGKMMTYNRRFVEMWGITDDVVESRSDEKAIQSVLHKLSDPESFLKRVKYLYEHRDEESHDQIGLKDGRIFHRYSAPVRTNQNDHYGRIWFFRDITVQKRAERQLTTQYAVTRILADSSTLGEATPLIIRAICESIEWDLGAIWRADLATNRLHCIDLWHSGRSHVEEFSSVTRKYRFKPGEGLPGRVWTSGRPHWIPDVVKDANFPRGPVAARENLHGAFGFPIRLGSEVLGVIEFFSREIRQPDEELLRMMEVIGTQIGQFIERRRAEEELRASEEKYRAVVETANDAMISADRTGAIISFNGGAERIFGYKAGEVLGKPLPVLMPERYRNKHLGGFRRSVEEGDLRAAGKTLEFAGLRKDGSEFPLEISVASWKTSEGAFFTGILRDITERRRSEADLLRAAGETRKAYDDLKRAQRDLIRAEKLASVGMVMSGIAHEINNPLNVMYGNLSLLKERCGQFQARVRQGSMPSPGELAKVAQMVQDALMGAENARRIVEEFRHFARDSREAEVMDLGRCLREAAEVVKPLCGSKVRLVVRVGRLPAVRFFPGQLRRAVANLLKNGIEAVEGGGTVSLSASKRGQEVLIEVQDTGRGIDPKDMERMFEPFFTTKAAGKGFGLGLALCEAVIHNHKGDISVQSKRGRGTKFTIRLPLP